MKNIKLMIVFTILVSLIWYHYSRVEFMSIANFMFMSAIIGLVISTDWEERNDH